MARPDADSERPRRSGDAPAADPFLALVELGDPYRGEPVGLDRARAAVADAEVQRWLRSLASAAPATARSQQDDRRALVDRDELEALISDTPLAAHARRLAHHVAAEALHLEPAHSNDPHPRSRLGGPPLLPTGVVWPSSDDGGILTPVAAIDLTELPPSTVTTALPAKGWLLFFAEMYSEHSEGLDGSAANEPGSVAQVLFAEDVVAAEPPAALRDVDGGVLEHRPVLARRMLTLPSDYEAADRLGLDIFEAEAYDELLERLATAMQPETTAAPLTPPTASHWIGGHSTGSRAARSK